MRVVRKLSRLGLALALTAAPAAAQEWAATMLGSNENPANASTATGFTFVRIVGNQLSVHIEWNGITGGALTAGHIHCCVAPPANVGVAVPYPGLPATTSGVFDVLLDLSNPNTYTTAFRNNFGGGTALGAKAALIAGLNAGTAYSNVHNTTFPGGEIRGFLTAVPEPSTYMLMASGLMAVGGVALRRRRA